MMSLNEFHEEASVSNSKVKKSTNLMMDIKMYVAKSINKIIILILVAWEIVMD